MKTLGLSSKIRKNLRHTAKATNFARLEEIQHAQREKQRILRQQAERARLAAQQKAERESGQKPEGESDAAE